MQLVSISHTKFRQFFEARVLICGFLVLNLFFLAPKGILAAVSISPAFVEVSLDRGRPSGQFIISNLGDEEERYRIKAIHFTFLKDGGLRRIEPDERSLAAWVKFNPTEFTLGPKTTRAIRFVISPRGALKPGEYWAAMELESLKTLTTAGKDEFGREFQLEIIPSIVVPMFGISGKVRYDGIIKDVNLGGREGGQVLELLIGNTGDGRLLIEGEYEVTKDSGEPMLKGTLGNKAYVLPGLEQFFYGKLESSLPEGMYKVRVTCRSPQLKQPIQNEFPLVLKAP